MTLPDGPTRHRCTAPDGNALRGLFWPASKPRGIVLIRTPYDARAHAATGRAWASRGLCCLVQDVRGRYSSAGTWRPYGSEGRDGAATVEQLRRAYPGLPIVLYGASYGAHCALEAALCSVAVDAVVVAVPALGLAETAWDANNQPQYRHRIGWWHEHGRTRTAQEPLPAAVLESRTRQMVVNGVDAATAWGWSDDALHAWRHLWQAERIDLADRYRSVRTPLLVLSGDDDFFDHDARRLARTWPGPTEFSTGPWGHRIGPGVGTAVIDPWLARTLPASFPKSDTTHHERTTL